MTRVSDAIQMLTADQNAPRTKRQIEILSGLGHDAVARAAGEPVQIPSTGGLADGLLAVRIGSTPFAHHQAFVDEVVTVPDGALPGAVRFLLDRLKLVAEPSGAITVAGILRDVVGYDVVPERRSEAEAAGVTIAESAAEVAQRASTIVWFCTVFDARRSFGTISR